MYNDFLKYVKMNKSIQWATSLFWLTDFRWAKAKTERKSLYLDQSSTKLWSKSTDLHQND